MRAQSAATAAAAVRSDAVSRPLLSIGRAAVVVAAVIAAGGCAPPRSVAVADPADPAAPVARVRAVPVIDRYEPLRPQTPAGWPAQNRRVAPQADEVR